MNKASVSATEYATKIKAGTGSAQSYANAQRTTNTVLRETSISANIASKGIKLLSATLNMVAFTLIINGIGLLIDKIDEWVVTVDEAKESADAFKESLSSFFGETQSNLKTITSLSDRFNELSKNVDTNGKQIGGTTEEYDEFLGICEQVGQIMPELITGYTNEGQAIITLRGEVDNLTESYKNAIRAKAALFLSNGDDEGNTVESFFEDYNNFVQGTNPLASGSYDTSIKAEKEYGYDTIHGWLSSVADATLEDLQTLEVGTNKAVYIATVLKEAGYDISKISTENYNAVHDVLNNKLSVMEQGMVKRVENIKNAFQNMLYADSEYWEIEDDNIISAINSVYASIDDEFIKQNNLFSKTALQTFESDLVSLFTDDITKQAMLNFYSPMLEDETVRDYTTRISSALTTIQAYCNEHGIIIPIEAENDSNNINELVNDVKNKLQGIEFDNKVKDLTLGDLKIASELKVPSDSIQSWEELIGLIEKVKTSNIDKVTLSTQLTNSKEALETFTSSVHSAFDAYSTLMNPNVSSADMLSSITQLSELAKTMGKDLNWEMLYGFGDTVTQLGSSIEYISEEYAKSVLSGAGIDSKFVDMLAHSIVQAKQAETQLSRLDSQIDSLQSSYTDLTDIIETYNSNGYITFDQLQKLLALEPQYLACLVDENGQLSLNNESMKLLAEQRLNEAKAQIIQQAITELSELVTHKETTALADNITTRQEQLGKLSEYSTKMADAIAKTAVETELVRELNAELGNASANGASEKDINQVLDNAYKKFKLVDKIGSTDLTKTLGGSSSKSAKDTAKTFDWIETLISRIQRNITNLGKLVSATYRNWSTRNNALVQEMAEVNKEINAQMTAYNAYMGKANSIPLAEGYKALVRSGAYDISTITDEKLQEQISEYEEWYNKALDASDVIEDLRANLAELAMTKFNNVSEQYDEQISLITHNVSMLEGFVSQSEAAGYMASEVYYKAMADKQQENITQLQGEYSSLLSAFDEAVKNGSIEKYSSDWYEMLSAINDVELELQDATTQLVEFNQTLQQLSWEVFDRIRESVNDITTEAEFLIDILDSKDLHTDKGVITDEGLAVQGLHAVNYNTYMEQAITYDEEMRKIEAEMANDPYDMELVDRRNELLELQQEAIQSAMSEKEAIHSLWEEGYNKMLESLDKLISKRKEALQATKDMYDYENTISEKTSNISSLQKQLQAYAGDNSESAKATIQKLQVSLSEAEKDLQQTEYEKYISDQEQMLDSLYDQTEQWVNERLDNLDGLVAESVDATNKNAETISNAIHEASNAYGYKLSDQMETIWDYEANAIDGVCTIVTVYGDILKGTNENIANNITTGTTNVVTAINGLNGSMQTMIGKLNEIATANANSIAQAQNAVVNGQNSSYPTNNKPSTPTVSATPTTKPSTQPSKKPTNTPKYNILNQDGIIINSNLTEEEAKKIVSANGHRGWRMVKAYKSGTTNADKGFHLVSDGNGDEIVLTNDGNAVLAKGMQLFPFEGGETVFDATKTAELLKGSLVPLSADQLWGNIVKTPKLPEMSKGVGGNVTYDVDKVELVLPNVKDYDSLVTEMQHDKRFERIVQSMTTDRLAGKGSLNKYKF